MDSDGLLDDKTILNELTDVLARVGVGNLVDLVGVQPHLWSQGQESEVESSIQAHLVLAALHDAGGKALLQPQGTHVGC